MNSQFDVQDNLPLTEATFFILFSLSGEPKHGYAIMKDVQELSEERVTLSTGTLYGALRRLLEQDWIERVEESELDANENALTGRPRKAYMLTRIGRRVLDAELNRLQRLVTIARPQGVGGQI